MAFELQYFAEQALILITVEGDVSLEEYKEISPQYLTMVEQVGMGTDVLVDLRTMRHFPTSINQLRQGSINVASPKISWIILLTGDRPILKLVATVLLQLQTSRVRMRVFDTLEDTIHFLKDTQPGARARSDWFDDFYKVMK